MPKDAPASRRAFAAAKIDVRALKIAAYGFFISAPMGHVLVGALQKVFAGKTSRSAKIGQLLANNLIIAPIQTFGAFPDCSLLSSRIIQAADFVSSS